MTRDRNTYNLLCLQMKSEMEVIDTPATSEWCHFIILIKKKKLAIILFSIHSTSYRKKTWGQCKKNKKGQKHYWNICIRAAQHASLLGLKHENNSKEFHHTTTFLECIQTHVYATQQNINCKHTHAHKIGFKDASLKTSATSNWVRHLERGVSN